MVVENGGGAKLGRNRRSYLSIVTFDGTSQFYRRLGRVKAVSGSFAFRSRITTTAQRYSPISTSRHYHL